MGSKLLYKEGQVLPCRGCGVELYEATKDIYTFTMAHPDDIKPIHAEAKEPQRMRYYPGCPLCRISNALGIGAPPA